MIDHRIRSLRCRNVDEYRRCRYFFGQSAFRPVLIYRGQGIKIGLIVGETGVVIGIVTRLRFSSRLQRDIRVVWKYRLYETAPGTSIQLRNVSVSPALTARLRGVG